MMYGSWNQGMDLNLCVAGKGESELQVWPARVNCKVKETKNKNKIIKSKEIIIKQN